VPGSHGDRLLAVERALAGEQRELRLFIEGLGPAGRSSGPADGGRPDGLVAGLEAVRERIALAWKTPISIRVEPGTPPLPPEFAEPLPLMVHEAIVNALNMPAQAASS
jgi:signal transduction histidine kinase